MRIDISRSIGWSLAIGGLILVAVTGELDWIVILFPASLILGYLRERKTPHFGAGI